RDRGRCEKALSEIVRRQNLRFTPGPQNKRLAGLADHVDLAIGAHRRCEEEPAEALAPDLPSGGSVGAGHYADFVGHVDQSLVMEDGRYVGRSVRNAPLDMRGGDVPAASRTDRNQVAVAISTAEIDGSILKNGGRYRGLPFVACMPENLAG